jgi:hypothetical protein
MNIKYPKLHERMIYCRKLAGIDNNIKYAMKDMSLCYLFDFGIDIYEHIAEYCYANQINKIYDIGCGFGHQSEIFFKKKILIM